MKGIYFLATAILATAIVLLPKPTATGLDIHFLSQAQAATAPTGRIANCASPVAIERIKKPLKDQMHADFAGMPDRFRPHAFKIFDTAIIKVDQIDTVASSQDTNICEARLSIHYTDQALLSYHKVNVLLSQIRMSEAASPFSLAEKDAFVRMSYIMGIGSLAGTENILFDKGVLTERVKFQIRAGNSTSNFIPPNFDGMTAISRVLSVARAGAVAKNMTPSQRALENQRYSAQMNEMAIRDQQKIADMDRALVEDGFSNSAQLLPPPEQPKPVKIQNAFEVRIESSPEHFEVIEDRLPAHAPPIASYPGSEFGLIPEDPRPISER